MFCPKCGKQLPDRAAFCNQCGTPIARVQQPPVQQAPAPTLDDMPADIPENDLPF